VWQQLQVSLSRELPDAIVELIQRLFMNQVHSKAQANAHCDGHGCDQPLHGLIPQGTGEQLQL
jgi:hypothetical protein